MSARAFDKQRTGGSQQRQPATADGDLREKVRALHELQQWEGPPGLWSIGLDTKPSVTKVIMTSLFPLLLSPSPATLTLYVSCTLASFLVLQFSGPVSSSGPLPCCSLCLAHCSLRSPTAAPSHPAGLGLHVTSERPSQTTQNETVAPPPHYYPIPHSVSCPAFFTIWNFLCIYLFSCVLSNLLNWNFARTDGSMYLVHCCVLEARRGYVQKYAVNTCSRKEQKWVIMLLVFPCVALHSVCSIFLV